MTGAKKLLEKYTPCKILMEFHTILLKLAAAAPPMETVALLQNAGYQPTSHNIEQVKAAASGNGVLDTVWEHESIGKHGSPDSCWDRCMPS